MATGQLWLFPPPRPLVERFGEEFFRALPTAPGVYLMCGDHEGVLYVGKARSLKARVVNYTRIAGQPTRIARMIMATVAMEFVTVRTEAVRISVS